MGWYLAGQSIWYIILLTRQSGGSVATVLNGWGGGVSLALACYGVVTSSYPFILCGYHFYLVFTGQNTHEYVHLERDLLTLVTKQGGLTPRPRETIPSR
jgi:hypothetical protein